MEILDMPVRYFQDSPPAGAVTALRVGLFSGAEACGGWRCGGGSSR